jgi:hypothetical protein|tara:strand:+ start:30 stop:440 length:411 start_codon:yes stop_codon:yes gene_type:complete
MKVIHNILLLRQNGDTEYHDVEGEWNEEGSGGPSFDPIKELIDCRMIEYAYGLDTSTHKEVPILLNEEGLYKETNVVNERATAMQREWCAANGRMQLSPIVGDVAVDLGLCNESLSIVSHYLEGDEHDRENYPAQT